MSIDDLDLTDAQRALYDLAVSIPEGRWTSYADLGEAMVEMGCMRPAGRGSLGRGAASVEDSLRLRIKKLSGTGNVSEMGLWDFGYPWHRVRNEDGQLVFGGAGRDRKVVVDSNSPGNVRLREENGEVVGGGYASQRSRFVLTTASPKTEAPLCPNCFITVPVSGSCGLCGWNG